MEKIKWDAFSDSHVGIREKILELIKVLDEDAKRHIQRGLYMRLGMMEYAIITFDSRIGKSDEPLAVHLTYELSLLLNAYYLNLCGSLDNIAWALMYHHDLLDSIDENSRQHRQFASLGSSVFLNALRAKKLEEMANELLNMKSWFSEVRELRDPAAHRIPMYLPTAIYSESNLRKRNELDSKADELIRNGKYKEGANLTYESESLGKHIPIFFVECPEISYRDLPKQINKDHVNWIALMGVCLDMGFK